MKSAIPVGLQARGQGQAGRRRRRRHRRPGDATQPRFGKVFFSIGRSNYVCSGTATTSANGDVVTTPVTA